MRCIHPDVPHLMIALIDDDGFFRQLKKLHGRGQGQDAGDAGGAAFFLLRGDLPSRAARG